jgi:hypothetical protein
MARGGVMDLLARFEKKYTRAGADECWVWSGAMFQNGYGGFYMGGKTIGAHRAAYTLAYGPIPDGLVIDHRCLNKACVNPSHLRAVTSATNTIIGTGPSACNARKTHCNRGHAFTSENIRWSQGKRHCRACSRRSVRGRDKV